MLWELFIGTVLAPVAISIILGAALSVVASKRVP